MIMLKKLVIFLLFLLAPVNSFSQNIKEDSLNCLTKNIYFEAKSQSIAGQLAVALVVMNRVKNSKFPSTICAVIYEGPHYESWKTKAIPGLPKKSRTYYPRRDRCQFSWYCDGKSDNPSEQSAVDKAQRIAWLVMNGHVFDFTNGSLYYHADYVNPKWAKNKIKIVQIDNHIFYGEVYDR